MRRRRGAVTAVALLLVVPVWAFPAGAAVASGSGSGPSPTAGQVERARQAAAAKAAQVRQAQERLGALVVRLTSAQATLEAAARAYDDAEQVLARRTEAADQAQRALQQVAGAERTARTAVGRLAVVDYESGGDLSGLGVLLGSSGPQDLAAGDGVLRFLGDHRSHVLGTLTVARTVSADVRRSAVLAAEQQRQAAAAAASAQAAASAGVATAQAGITQARAEQEALVTQLAHLQQVSVTLERQRQKALRDAAAAASQAVSTTSAKVHPQAVAQALAARRGWTGGQFQCLVWLWTRESGWYYRATNPSSGAYGIPQSLPPGKMATAGPDWRTNPVTQIRWGLQYIADAYGSPCGAWSHETAYSWY